MKSYWWVNLLLSWLLNYLFFDWLILRNLTSIIIVVFLLRLLRLLLLFGNIHLALLTWWLILLLLILSFLTSCRGSRRLSCTISGRNRRSRSIPTFSWARLSGLIPWRICSLRCNSIKIILNHLFILHIFLRLDDRDEATKKQ